MMFTITPFKEKKIYVPVSIHPSPVHSRIWGFILSNDHGVTKTVLSRNLRNLSKLKIDSALDDLVKDGIIDFITLPKRGLGRPITVFRCTPKGIELARPIGQV